MKKILVTSKRGDSDGITVAAALEARGCAVTRWIGDNYPGSQTASICISEDGVVAGEFLDEQDRLDIDDIDVVWLRRPRWPKLPSDLHRDDLDVAETECKEFIRSVFQAAWRSATWVNSLHGKRLASSKILQLRLATELGLKIPKTIISNDPSKIKEFLETSKEQVIVKALLGGGWMQEETFRTMFTAKVNIDMLPNDRSLRACPCVFQNEIKKAFEVRATFFGREVCAIRLDSQVGSASKTDWRAGDPYAQAAREIRLPDLVYKKCLLLMQRLDILHGSFDFAIDENGEWIFFEVNEAGQFLWLESCVPQMNVLEVTAQFLERPSSDFRAEATKTPMKLENLVNSPRFLQLWKEDQHNIEAEVMTASL